MKESRYGLLFILPLILLLGFIFAYPLFKSIFISLFRWRLSELQTVGPTFVGLGNYVRLINSPGFFNSIFVTFYYVGLSVCFSLLLGLLTALILNESFKGRNLVRALCLVPYMLAPVAAAVMWKWLFNQPFGVLNSFNMQLGLNPVSWLSDPAMAVYSCVIASVWIWFPFAAIFLLAGLQTIPPELYKAAKVDGANIWQRFRHITLAMILPFIVIVALLEITFACKIPDIIYVLTGGGPGTATKVLSFYSWEQAFKLGNFGYGTAIGYFAMIVSLSIVGILYLLLRKGGITFLPEKR